MNKPTPPVPEEAGFLSRWSRRKVRVDRGEIVEEASTSPESTDALAAPRPAAAAPNAAAPATPAMPADDAQAKPAPPPLTMDDVQALTGESDFRRFVRHDVDGPVRNAALKKLFTDPHYNVMDGLDTYIDDYNRADPLPASMLAKMAQSQFLGFLTNEEDSAKALPTDAPPDPADTGAPPETASPDEDPDLRLQPDDAAAGEGAERGAGEDVGRER